MLDGFVPAGAFAVRDGKFKAVPVVGKAAGGYMAERIWGDGDYPVGATGEYTEVTTSDPHAFVIAVEGPSMIPRYNPGEYALVEPGTDVDLEDDVLVRLSSGQTLLKRLVSRRSGVSLSSYNNSEILHFDPPEVTWMYYVMGPVPRKKIKNRI